ncbi:hypothetical protein IEQ34_005954 [Dendrobium chrysotoxum]|uniref:Uncharacterized protein n=1 Tax=Dendrobium chrysotoxum TaxID=161865 RepID=A0AAV7HAD1_DENCH|nr:hypothetical protein IEQ34_005954 [Dendrobium chrysotoxum]
MANKIAALSVKQMKRSRSRRRNIKKAEKMKRRPIPKRGQVKYRIAALARNAIRAVVVKATKTYRSRTGRKAV